MSEENNEEKPCLHPNHRDVGSSAEGMGSIIVYWCPDCGALKRTMTDWKCTDYPWELPGRSGKELQELRAYKAEQEALARESEEVPGSEESVSSE